jgi:hypothetical protein
MKLKERVPCWGLELSVWGFDGGATLARNLKFRMREGRMGLVCSEGGRWSGLVIVELEGDEVS